MEGIFFSSLFSLLTIHSFYFSILSSFLCRYVDDDLIVWNSVCQLETNGTKMCLVNYTSSLSLTDMKGYISTCNPLILNVRQGSHWVLGIGYDDAIPDLIYVNDPYFNVTSYHYSDIVKTTVYGVEHREFALENWTFYRYESYAFSLIVRFVFLISSSKSM